MANQNNFGIAGLLGWPVAHSRSPVIHNHWLAHHGIAGRYVLFPVPPEKLEAAVRGIAALGLRGCNVTTPHKRAIFPLLDRVDELARKIGAVNTVVVEPDGTLTGFNNDGNGFIQSLRDAIRKWRPDSRTDLVLGAGWRGRARYWQASARKVQTEITRCNRRLDKAQEIAGAVGPVVRCCPGTSARMHSTDIALSRHATSLGMAGKPPLEISLESPSQEGAGRRPHLHPTRDAHCWSAAHTRGKHHRLRLGLLLNQRARRSMPGSASCRRSPPRTAGDRRDLLE
jgi:shikimate dehydrogenase